MVKGDYAIKFLGKMVDLVIDRALGTKHPECDIVYEVNYGYVPGTKAPDGDEVDAYVLGINEPVKKFTGRCIAVIHRTDDDDDKLVVVNDGEEFTDDQISSLTHFQEKYFNSKIVRK